MSGHPQQLFDDVTSKFFTKDLTLRDLFDSDMLMATIIKKSNTIRQTPYVPSSPKFFSQGIRKPASRRVHCSYFLSKGSAWLAYRGVSV